MYLGVLTGYDEDADLLVHVFDDQQHRAVQARHVPVQSLQAAPVDGRAVDQLPRIALGPCWHVRSELLEKGGVNEGENFHSSSSLIMLKCRGRLLS